MYSDYEGDWIFWVYAKNGITASFVPGYYGSFVTSYSVGYEQECFLIIEMGGGANVDLLSRYIESQEFDEDEMKNELRRLKCEMLEKNIICCDLHPGNVIRVSEKCRPRLIVIDGSGAPEFIPICKYVRFFGKKKILRQWEKFENRIRRKIEEVKAKKYSHLPSHLYNVSN